MTSSRVKKDMQHKPAIAITDDKTDTRTAVVAARGSADGPSPEKNDEDDDEVSCVELSILSIYRRCVFPRPRLPANCLMGQST